MPDPNTVPSAVATAIVGLAVAAVTYVAKLFIELIQNWQTKKAERHVRLFRLSALLKSAKVTFKVQNDQADRLLAMLRQTNPDAANRYIGYESTFVGLYDTFTEAQRDLHAIIRGYTIHGLKSANDSMSRWLEEDTHFRNEAKYGELAVQLNHLTSHLILWHSKYEIWIPITQNMRWSTWMTKSGTVQDFLIGLTLKWREC